MDIFVCSVGSFVQGLVHTCLNASAEVSNIEMGGSSEKKRVGILNHICEVTESLSFLLHHRVKFNVDINFPCRGHELIFETLQELIERENLKFISVYSNPGFPLETLKGSHDLDCQFVIWDIFIGDKVIASNVELMRNLGSEFTEVKDGTFVAFLFNNSKVLQVGGWHDLVVCSEFQ